MATPTLKALQSERTKAALVAAGRVQFAQRGYAGVSAEEVAAAANVTTGAVYHQFGSKRGLFLAVFEALEAELTNRVAGAAAEVGDPWLAFQAAALCFLDSSTERDVRQIVLIDGRSVLGWDEWHAIMARYGLGMTRAVVGGLIAPPDALSAIIFGALNEAALFVATAENPVQARDQTAAALGAVLQALSR